MEGVGDRGRSGRSRPSPGNNWSPAHPPCFIDISKMHCIFDMSLPRGESKGDARGRGRGMDLGRVV